MILCVPRWTFPTSMFEYSPHQHHLCYTLWEKVWLWRPNVCHSAKTHRWSYAPSWLSILACKSPSVLRSSSISLELVAQGHLLMLDCFEEALGYWNIAFFVQGFSAFVKSHSVMSCRGGPTSHGNTGLKPWSDLVRRKDALTSAAWKCNNWGFQPYSYYFWSKQGSGGRDWRESGASRRAWPEILSLKTHQW